MAPTPVPSRLPTTPPPRQLNDQELLAEYRTASSERAFQEIVARHGGMVFRTCLRLLGNSHEAEDAAQAAFIVLARRPAAVSSPLPIWLHWVARNTASKIIRARGRRAYYEKEAARMMTTVDAPSSNAHLREELDAALDKLPVVLRQAVILRYLEGRGQEEAARLAGCPQGTLARRSMEGLQKLRSILQRRGMLLSAAALTTLLAQEASAALPVMSLLPLKLAAARTVPSASALLVAESVISAMYWGKVKLFAAAVALLGTIVLAGTVVTRLAGKAEVARVDEAAAPASRLLVTPKPDEQITCPADCVVFSPDGATIASGRNDGSVVLWDARTGQEKGRYRGHSARARAVGFTADGKTLASGGWDKTVKLWDIATGKERATLTGHQGWVWSLAFSSDGKTLASASWDGTIKLWDVGAAKERLTLRGHQKAVHCVAFAPRGSLLASASSDGSAKLWNADTGRCQATLTGDMGEVMSVAFSPDGTVVAAASLTSDIRLWDSSSGRQRGRIAKNQVVAVAFSADGTTLASTGLDGTTVLWDWSANKERARFDRVGGWTVAFAPNGQSLAVAGGGTVTLLNPAAIPKRPAPNP
jgi:RNA polymerase sigma factor (sigma-70 family)